MTKLVSRQAFDDAIRMNERHRSAFVFCRALLPWGFLIGLGLGVCIGAWL